MSIGMCISGLGLGFVRGYYLSLAIIGFMPIIAVIGEVSTEALQTGQELALKAYGQSAGFAE